jgi:hypothetical protein
MSTTTAHTVLRHMRHHAAGAATAPADVPPGRELELGIPGITLRPDDEVAVDGVRLASEHRRLSHLLRAGGERGLYFADREAVTASHEKGDDPVLYHAIRDFLPPREKASHGCVPAGTPGYNRAHGREFLFADLVVYRPGTLPGGEPYRSTGHWNLPHQLELFQTLVGQVLMMVGGRTRDGRAFLYEQVCGPGEMMAVPFDIWHVTYVLAGPAVVFNLTTEAGGTARQPAHPGEEKYHRAEPIAVTAHRNGFRHAFVGSPAAQRVWGLPGAPPDTDWLRSFLLPGESLMDLHLNASAARLAALQDTALEAYRKCWPLGDRRHA